MNKFNSNATQCMNALSNKQNSEEVAFLPDIVLSKLTDIIEEVISKEAFDDKMINKWIDQICFKTMVVVKALHRPYKFIGEIR